MKIVLFDLNRLSFEGGAEKYLDEVGIKLSEKGHEVTYIGDFRFILYTYILSSLFLFINPPNKLIHLFRELSLSPSIKPKSKNYLKVEKLSIGSFLPFTSNYRKIKSILEKADAIFIKNEFAELLCLNLLSISNPNTYILIFSSLFYPQANSIRARIHNLIYRGEIYGSLIKKFKHVIVSNKNDENYFNKIIDCDRKTVFNVPYGLNTAYFPQKKEIFKSNGFKVFFVGRLEEQKGISYLSQIIEKINLNNSSDVFTFYIAGDGPSRSIISELSKRFTNVEYLGQLTKEEVKIKYLRSDLVIITSKWETFSYVCLEAQACGVPVVAFDIPGPQDILKKNTGVLVPLGKIDLFISQIFHYYNKKRRSASEYVKMKQEISNHTNKEFSIDSVTQKLESIIIATREG